MLRAGLVAATRQLRTVNPRFGETAVFSDF
jgi:hypothetical protein